MSTVPWFPPLSFGYVNHKWNKHWGINFFSLHCGQNWFFWITQKILWSLTCQKKNTFHVCSSHTLIVFWQTGCFLWNIKTTINHWSKPSKSLRGWVIVIIFQAFPSSFNYYDNSKIIFCTILTIYYKLFVCSIAETMKNIQRTAWSENPVLVHGALSRSSNEGHEGSLLCHQQTSKRQERKSLWDDQHHAASGWFCLELS